MSVSLLEDGPHMGVRGVRGKGKFSVEVGVGKRDSGDQGVLGGLKGGLKDG